MHLELPTATQMHSAELLEHALELPTTMAKRGVEALQWSQSGADTLGPPTAMEMRGAEEQMLELPTIVEKCGGEARQLPVTMEKRGVP